MDINEEARSIRSIAVNFERDEAIAEIVIRLENLLKEVRDGEAE